MELPIRRARDPEVDSDHERLRRSLAGELDRWPDFADDLISSMRDVVPLADLEESDDHYLLDVELPGVRRDDVSIEVVDRRVVVTGERRERRRLGLLRHRTRTTGRFRLDLTFPLDIDQGAVRASLDHGMLTLTVPKAERSRRRRIPVSRRTG